MTNIRCIGILLLCICGGAQADMEQEVEAPVSVEAEPFLGLQGETIVLSGETPFVKDDAKVSVTIKLPEGDEEHEPVQREAEVDSSGHWSLSYENAVAMGRYEVEVIAPDGKGRGETHFDIVDSDAIEALIKSLTELMQTTEDEIVAEVETGLTKLPASAEKTEATAKLAKVKQKLAEQRHARRKAYDDLGLFVAALKAPAAKKKLQPVLQQINDADKKAKEIRASLKASQYGTDACVNLDRTVEALGLLSAIMNFERSIVVTLINHISDKVNPAYIESIDTKEMNKQQKFMATEAQKVAISGLRGFDSLQGGVTGILIDCAAYVAKDLYESICTRFEGPFTGKLDVKFYTTEQETDVYWHYTIEIGGKLVLSAPKAFDNKPASTMRGRFEGAAIGYKVQEDAIRLIPAVEKYIIFRKLIAPPESMTLPPDEMGSGFNALNPLSAKWSFWVPVSATRKGEDVVLNVDEGAHKDILPFANRGSVYYVFNTGLMPYLVHQEVPMQDAAFILSRGMRKDAKFKITGDGGERHLKGTFARNENPPGIRLRWDVEVDACSPGCTKTSIDRIKPWWEAIMAKRKAAKKK